MTTELIHSDFETIERGGKHYRISTHVEYRVAPGNYRCKATLYRSRNGRPRFDRDKKYRRSSIASDSEEIDDVLSDCIEACQQKLDEIEEAKDVSVEVNISD